MDADHDMRNAKNPHSVRMSGFAYECEWVIYFMGFSLCMG
jgi:hypothetical protein